MAILKRTSFWWFLLAVTVLAVTFWLDHRAVEIPEERLITGVAEVIDGDSLRVAGHEIRLKGIDAFEYRQTCGTFRCGADAMLRLKALTEGQTVECTDEGRDRYERVLARCRVPSGDLGQAMVEAGLAVRYYDAAGRYAEAERTARHEESGAWAHEFLAPEAHRRQSH